ncbi:HD domain-containing phosphohydrolase [Azonexus sp. IMCC34839]|uniref:HD domain-containing phosphohydrolase n=1 Tax=Azonexus sp. IMCC34839 TaxID=3133695 RepID=UPI00399ABC2A
MTTNENVATLLFVDDEPGILSALRRLFRPHGYRILTAESGQEGLELLEGERVDLVISDMRMPEMDGATFLKAVRERWPGVMRVLLTGYADISSTVAAINQGEIYRYIAKPWDDNEIVTIVREALERQRLEAENRRLLTLTQQQNEELRVLNTSLEQKVSERTQDLRQTLTLLEQAHSDLKKNFLTSVQVFSGIIELRAGRTGSRLSGHGRRVAEMSRSLAKRLQVGDADIQNILLAGLLHDIGKLGLPDELLVQPFNSLTADGRTMVKKHPVIGQNILMAISRLSEAATLVRHHHECFDGSGYPDGLKGMSIPQGSRILAVANDYDALQMGTLAQRPLRPDEALAYIVDNRAKRYDPAVVDVFVALMTESGAARVLEMPERPAHAKAGAVLNRDLYHPDGYLLLAAGSTLTQEIINQLLRLENAEGRQLTLYIRQETA